MKKPTNNTRHRKLVVRFETLSQLTPLQLEKVVGGWTDWWPCQGASEAQKVCAEQPI